MDDSKILTLEKLVAKGRKLLRESDVMDAHRAFEYWDDYVADWLDKTFPGSGYSAGWSCLPSSSLVYGGHYYDDPNSWRSFKNAVQRRLDWISKLNATANPAVEQNKETKMNEKPESNKVFVVHGHNEAIREAVARFLEKLGLEPIILHEQPNKGRTIIEKFVDYSDVRFSVVLLTADDLGCKKGDETSKLLPRARQNVIFELGFFIAKLKRDCVCALHQNGIELPSDYHGVIYIPIDDGGAWRLQLAREMKASGLQIDLNLAL